MKITGGSALPKEDIDRMVKEAEEHADEDKKRREEAETRNQAESFAYAMEKQVADNRDKLPAEVVTEVETDVAAVKSALEGDDADAVKSAYEKLGQSSQKIGEALYSAEQQAAGTDGPSGDAPSAQEADEDVVDAEIVDDEDDKDRK
jgi:molecular chaperone DnaK